MLLELKVDNYVLIKSLRFKPQSGFNIITGETGAGKSILIGALGLILGERADSKTVSGNENKCVIEGVFDVRSLDLKPLFDLHDLDYLDETILRREILISGKSRAFINDTPVALTTLKHVGSKLVDIHSQHQSLLLGSQEFLFSWLDVVTKSTELFDQYKLKYEGLKSKQNQLADLQELVNSELAEKDYHHYLFTELEEAKLDGIVQSDIDREFDILQNAEEIGEVVGTAEQSLKEGEDSALDRLNVLLKQLRKLSIDGSELNSIAERLAGTIYELEEVVGDLSSFAEGAQPNPERLNQLNDLQSKLHGLQTKHRVGDLGELVKLRNELEEKLLSNQNREDELEALRSEIVLLDASCKSLAEKMHRQRGKSLITLEKEINADLSNLGLINAQLSFSLTRRDDLGTYGLTQFDILFTSNIGSDLQPAYKVASGGELSRLMLILKSYLAHHKKLPCIIFDEIDTGVSGEIALKMADVMVELADGMQVISITHLPQIASKGRSHYYVYKQLEAGQTSTFIKHLNQTDRIIELAKMLSGDNPSEGAIANAKELLN